MQLKWVFSIVRRFKEKGEYHNIAAKPEGRIKDEIKGIFGVFREKEENFSEYIDKNYTSYEFYTHSSELKQVFGLQNFHFSQNKQGNV